MCQILMSLAMVAVVIMISACGKSPMAPVGKTNFAMSSSASVQPTRAAKPVSFPRDRIVLSVAVAENNKIVNDKTIYIRFSRSISGRKLEWRWVASTDVTGVAGFEIIDTRDVSGYYIAQAFIDPTLTLKIGEWRSIPINPNPDGELSIFLAIGGQAKVTSYTELDRSRVQPQLQVSVSTYPVAGDVVVGTRGHTFTNIVFDATAASEDIVVSKVRSQLILETPGTATDMSNGQLFDGTTALNNGPLIINPSAGMGSGDEVEFKMGLTLVVPKGTVKTVSIKFNMSADPSGISGVSTYAWGIKENPESIVAFGAVSGKRVGVHINGSGGQPWTLRASGILKVDIDPSTSLDREVIAGSMDVPILALRFSAFYESIRLSQIGFNFLGSKLATVLKLTIWDGKTKVGEAIFSGRDLTAISSLGFSEVVIPAGESKVLTIKVDTSPIGISWGVSAGDFMSIGCHGGNIKGVGLSSGAVVSSDPSFSFWGATLKLISS